MTVSSMTGFARAEGQFSTEGVIYSWIWEIRSVNGRGLDVRTRMPQGLENLSLIVKDAVSKYFSRGNVSVFLNIDRIRTEPEIHINQKLLVKLSEMAADWQDQFPGTFEKPTIDGLLNVPGVIEHKKSDEDEAVLKERNTAILGTLDAALKALAKARADEGERMKSVILGQLDTIADITAKMNASASLRPEAVKERMKKQVTQLLEAAATDLPEERLLAELAILAVKADICEEIDRLNAHVDSARDMLGTGGPVGRKLDFLCQEFNREANTACSKSQDRELTRHGLDLKTVIDQMREQVQNIE